MNKVKFKEVTTVNGQVKICPECKTEILLKWTHAYNHEWCPNCGLNMDENEEPKK